MKKLLLILLCLPMMTFLSGCITVGMVSPMGNGNYILSGHANTGWVSLGKIRQKVLAEADEFSKNNNSKYEVVAINEVKTGLAVFPQVDLTFRLVNESEKLANPNTNSKTTIKAGSASGKTTTKQIISKKDNSKKDDEKYDRLLKLGKLKDAGILTEEEFNKEKKKILNDE